MTLSELKEILERTELPVCYNAFPVGDAPALPFIVYIETGSNNFGADNKVFYKSKQIAVELYTATKSASTEELVESVLDGADIFYLKQETYLDDEKCYEVIYTMEV